MLGNTEYNNISIENDKREMLLTFMLSWLVYSTRSLTLVYMEVMANIQY